MLFASHSLRFKDSVSCLLSLWFLGSLTSLSKLYCVCLLEVRHHFLGTSALLKGFALACLKALESLKATVKIPPVCLIIPSSHLWNTSPDVTCFIRTSWWEDANFLCPLDALRAARCYISRYFPASGSHKCELCESDYSILAYDAVYLDKYVVKYINLYSNTILLHKI
jgi:hypothetical protein